MRIRSRLGRTAALIAVVILAVAALASQVVASPTPDSQPPNTALVARLYYRTPEELARLVADLDALEIPATDGYLTILTDERQMAELAAQGYRIEIDGAQTQRLKIEPEPFMGGYLTVEEMQTFLQTTNANYGSITELYDIGDSWEKVMAGGNPGYDVWALRITNEAIPGPKPRFFLMSEIHAREIATPEISKRYIDWLVLGYGTNPDATWLVNYHEIFVVPMVNPDGHKKAELGQLWRKNTDNDDGCGTSFGVDLNRNHSFKWGVGGSSTNPCSETYRGPSVGSEPETQLIQNYVLSLFPDQRGPLDTDPAPITATGILITMHSYSELVLWPWGWTGSPAPNSAQLSTIGTKFATYNTYTPQQGFQLYQTSGTTDDWSYGQLGIASFTFEIGTTFFENYATVDATLWPENRGALIYAHKIARTPYMTAYGPDALNVATSPITVTQGTPAQVTATINDSQNGNQMIMAAELYVDAPDWAGGVAQAMAPTDGAFNTPVEGAVATLNTALLSVGRHVILVRGRDAGNNWGPYSAAFLDVIPVPITPTSTPSPTRTNTPTRTPTATATQSPATCTLSAAKSGNNVMLSWTAEPGAIQYRIYRGTSPYFTPPYGSPYATTAGLTYTDVGASGNPAINYAYVVSAWNGSVEAACQRRAGEFDFALTAGADTLNDIALPLNVSAVIQDADDLSDWIDAAHVLQALKWDATNQNFLAWSNEFGFGDNFATETGDYVFLLVDGSVAPVASFVGLVPPAGSVQFDLIPGTASDCALNFLSLPLDRADLTNADQLSDDIGGVEQALDWDAPVQNFLAWSNEFGFGDNFPTAIGYPYIVCMGPQAPGEDAYVSQVDPTTAFGNTDPTHLVAQGSRGLTGPCNTTKFMYAKFPLTLLASNTTTATLALNNVQYSGSPSGLLLGLYAIADDSWSEFGLTWNNRPALGSLLSQTSQVSGQPRIVFPTSTALVNHINAQRAGDHILSLAVGWADCPTLSAPQLRVDSSEGAIVPEFSLTASTTSGRR